MKAPFQTPKILAFILAFTAAGITWGGPDSIGVRGAAWSKPVLKVCWQTSKSRASKDVAEWAKKNYHADLPASAFMSTFETWVNNAYSVARVGIGFEGFRECPESDDSLAAYPVYLINDMQLFKGFARHSGKSNAVGISVLGDPNKYLVENRVSGFVMRPLYKSLSYPAWESKVVPYKAAVGFDFKTSDRSVETYFSYAAIGIEQAMGLDPKTKSPSALQLLVRAEAAKEAEIQKREANQFTVLHELGHLAGLLHEDRRHDAARKRPDYCVSVARDADHENAGSFGKLEEERFGTEYDPFSIMSYCRDTMHRLFHEGRLVCRLAPKMNARGRYYLKKLLPDCPEIMAMSFLVDLSARDVNALRQIYLKAKPGVGSLADFHKSRFESRLYEIIEDIARLEFNPQLVPETNAND